MNYLPADSTLLIEKNPAVHKLLLSDFQIEIESGKLACYNECAFDFISNILLPNFRNKRNNANTVLYFDPPYLHSSRKDKNLYGSDYELSDKQHSELLHLILKLSDLNFNICISTYPNELYDKTFKNWNYIEFNSTTRHGTAVENLYFNYQYPVWNKHEYTYVGENYREREKIKLKTQRYINKLKNMPELERATIINSIKNQFKIK